MKLLALDTSSAHSSLAVLEEGEILLEYNVASADQLSATLIPGLEFTLKSIGLALEAIDLFAISIGPGQFTGIRIGIATLKGLLLGSSRPVVPVVSLAAIAAKFAEASRPVVSLIDARRGEVYLAAYRFADGLPVELIAPRLAPPDRLPEILTGLADPLFAGSGADAYAPLLRERFPAGRVAYRSPFLAGEIGHIAAGEYAQGRFLTGSRDLRPLYVRLPDAKEPAPPSADAVAPG